MHRKFVRQAHAKVNLFLHVIEKRSDGYHNIESLCVKSKIADTVTVTSSEELVCEMQGAQVTENIALKAAAKLLHFSGISCGAKIVIKKHIPLCAGLGGGSADAAATLLALRDLWNLKVPDDILYDIALSLGADVPFCLQDAPCFVTGIGDVLNPLSFNKVLHLIFVNSGHQIPTAAVYHDLRTFSKSLKHPLDKEDLLQLVLHGCNDLTAAAHIICPELKSVAEILSFQKDVISVRMSGSGATYFAIFPDDTSAKAALKALQDLNTGWQLWQEALPI